jgi:hypothetical protein
MALHFDDQELPNVSTLKKYFFVTNAFIDGYVYTVTESLLRVDELIYQHCRRYLK